MVEHTQHTFANYPPKHNDSFLRTARDVHGVPTTSSISPYSSPSGAAHSLLPPLYDNITVSLTLTAIPIQSSLDPHQDTYAHKTGPI